MRFPGKAAAGFTHEYDLIIILRTASKLVFTSTPLRFRQLFDVPVDSVS